MGNPPTPPIALTRARSMRRDATPAEAALWRAVRANQLNGLKVRRQVPLGPFILDFAIMSERLVIEVDGDTHAEDPARDAARTAWLTARGWRVIRFTNAEVLGNMDGALLHLTGRPPSAEHPSASPTP